MKIFTSLLGVLPISLLWIVALPPNLAAADDLTLAIGDPSRSDRQVEVRAGTIADTRRGDRIPPAELAGRLAAVRLVFVGEDHTSMDAHRAQLRVIQDLHRAGRKVVIALEMYPWTRQQELDAWIEGRYDDEEFLEASDWYEVWGYRWEYYRDIFRFARQKKLAMVGINAPRDLVRQVRQSGTGVLSSADQDRLPPRIDMDSAEHRRLFQTYMGSEAGSHGDMAPGSAVFEGLFRAQCLWDGVMGWNALRALQRRPDAETVVVVLLGTGHVAYGLGATRQIAGQLPPESMATVIPVARADGTKVQSSYADFIWGQPEPEGPLYPELGLSLAGAPDANRILRVVPASPAAKAGLVAGERLLAINGAPVQSSTDVRRGLAGTRWGDRLKLKVAQGDQAAAIREVTVKLERADAPPPAPPSSQETPHASPPRP